jgi:hypothetical protein
MYSLCPTSAMQQNLDLYERKSWIDGLNKSEEKYFAIFLHQHWIPLDMNVALKKIIVQKKIALWIFQRLTTLDT